jgi:hypothetical protein
VGSVGLLQCRLQCRKLAWASVNKKRGLCCAALVGGGAHARLALTVEAWGVQAHPVNLQGPRGGLYAKAVPMYAVPIMLRVIMPATPGKTQYAKCNDDGQLRLAGAVAYGNLNCMLPVTAATLMYCAAAVASAFFPHRSGALREAGRRTCGHTWSSPRRCSMLAAIACEVDSLTPSEVSTSLPT